jgi:hypothetical protein
VRVCGRVRTHAHTAMTGAVQSPNDGGRDSGRATRRASRHTASDRESARSLRSRSPPPPPPAQPGMSCSRLFVRRSGVQCSPRDSSNTIDAAVPSTAARGGDSGSGNSARPSEYRICATTRARAEAHTTRAGRGRRSRAHSQCAPASPPHARGRPPPLPHVTRAVPGPSSAPPRRQARRQHAAGTLRPRRSRAPPRPPPACASRATARDPVRRARASIIQAPRA